MQRKPRRRSIDLLLGHALVTAGKTKLALWERGLMSDPATSDFADGHIEALIQG
jgi:hypothetical protein